WVAGVSRDCAGVVDTCGNRSGVRVEEQLCGIEAGTGGRVPRAVDAKAVSLLGPDAVDEDGPNPVVVVRHVVVGLIAVFVDESELDSVSTRCPQPKRGTAVADVGTKNRGVLRHWQGSGHIYAPLHRLFSAPVQ